MIAAPPVNASQSVNEKALKRKRQRANVAPRAAGLWATMLTTLPTMIRQGDGSGWALN